MSNKELEVKIIDYLKKLEKNELPSQISSKKKNLLLVSKKEYENLDQEQKDYWELSQEVNQEEQNLGKEEHIYLVEWVTNFYLILY